MTVFYTLESVHRTWKVGNCIAYVKNVFTGKPSEQHVHFLSLNKGCSFDKNKSSIVVYSIVMAFTFTRNDFYKSTLMSFMDTNDK